MRGAKSESPLLTWRMAAELFTRPQPVTPVMVALFAIVPVYLYIGNVVSKWAVNVPALRL